MSVLNVKHFPGKEDAGRGYDSALMKLKNPKYFTINLIFSSWLKIA